MRSRGYVGSSLWDFGSADVNDNTFYKFDPQFYRSVMEDHLRWFGSFNSVLELQQEALHHFPANGAWSSLDLYQVDGFLRCLISNEFLAIHAKTQGVDITDFENENQRARSLRQMEGCIDFAIRINADAITFHPGTYNEKAGNFWPKPEDALRITNMRRVTFEDSLRKIVQYFVDSVRSLEESLERQVAQRPRVVQELEVLFRELREADPLRGSGRRSWVLGHEVDPLPSVTSRDELSSSQRLSVAQTRDGIQNEISRIIADHELSIPFVRYCRNPSQGVHLVLQNVDPPNFLVNTPRQHAKWHSRMTEFYSELVEIDPLLAGKFEKYRPLMLLDPGHYLNSQVIFKQPENVKYGHLFEDMDQFLHSPFVTLPGDYPRRGSETIEPILNSFVRKHGDDILYCHVGGSKKMDRWMTTHDPIKAFRTRRFMQVNQEAKPALKFTTQVFDADTELNLEEVVQVVGFDKIWVPVIFDSPYEVVLSSCIHLDAYLSYLGDQYDRMMTAVQKKLRQISAGENRSGYSEIELAALGKSIETARFFLRPNRQAGMFWKPGYEEAVFYGPAASSSEVNIRPIAVVREDDSAVQISASPA